VGTLEEHEHRDDKSGGSSHHNDYTLDAMRKSIITALLPVRSGFGVLLQHAGRAVGEEVNWCEPCKAVS
jgi:hypothetical protein